MKKTLFLVFILSLFFSCKLTEKTKKTKQKSYDFTIAFGSCNKQNKTNVLWKEIEKTVSPFLQRIAVQKLFQNSIQCATDWVIMEPVIYVLAEFVR